MRAPITIVHVLAALAAAAALVVLGIVRAAPERAGAAPNTLRVGLDAEPKTLDPHVTTALSDFRVLTNLYEGLVRFAPGSLSVEPALAERVEVSDDGLVYEFFLRQGVRFHDGTKLDAESVRFNLERMLDDRHPFHDTGPFPLASFFESVERVEARSPGRVALRLKEPFSPLLSNLAMPIGFLVSPASVRRFGTSFGHHGGGTGPFRVESWQPASAVVLARNPDYWGTRPELERIVFRPLADPMTRVAELRTGGIDVLPEASADLLPFFHERSGYTVHATAGPHLWFLILNARRPPFSDPRARRAINLAVDRQKMVEQLLGGTASIATSVIPAAFGEAHAADLEPYAFDPERARALLDASGARGARLALIVPTSGSGMLEPELMATAIQADLSRVGLEVSIRSYEWNAYLAEVNAGLDDGVHMAAMAWMTNDPDTLPYLTLRTASQPPHGFNSGWYSNHELDRLIDRARSEVDRTRRNDLYRRIDRLAHADAPFLFVASWKQTAVARQRVRGLTLQPSFFLRFAEAGAD